MLKKGSSKWMDLDPNNIAEVGKLSKGLQKVTQASGAKTVQQLLQYFDDQRKSKPKVEKEIETWPNKKSKISVESTNEDRRRILSKEEAKIISIETSKDIANEINELENSFSDPDKINPSISYEKFKELNQGDFFKRIDGDKFEKIKIPALGIEGQFTVRSIKESIKKSNYLVGEYYVLKNAEKILKEAKIIEIHNDHKLEKNENVLSVVAMVSFVKLDNELIPVKIIVKSYGEKADVPYKIYVFSARKEPKRDLLLQHRHLANAAIIHKSLQSINILDFFSVSRDFELFKYSPLELSKEQQSIVDKEKAKKERRLMAKEEKSLEPVEGNIGFEGGSSGGNGGNGGGKPPLPPSSLPPSGNDGNDGGDKGNKKPKGLPKSESQEINPYIEGRGREDSSSDDKSSARLIKDSANARKEKVYSLSDVRKALDTLTKEVGKLGEKNNFTEKDVKELFNALNIKDVETQDKAVSDFIDRLAERTYDIDGTEVSHIFDDNEKAELKQRLAEFLKSSGKPSELRKALDAFNDTVSRMNRSISRWKLKADTRVKYAKELSKLRSNEDKLKRGQTPAGQVVVGPLAMFDNAYKAMRLSKVDYGISENTFRGVSDALKGYNEDIFLDNPTMPYMYNSELRADVDTIDRYLNLLDSQKAIRAEKDDALEDASKAMVDLIGRINYEISEAQENFSLDMRKMNAVANEELNLFDYSTKGKKIGSIFTNVINNFISPGEVFATYIGLDSNITKLFTTDALEAIGNKYAMYLDFKDRYLSEKAIGFKTSVLKKKMKTKIGGNEIDIGTAALIYASSLSPSNKEEMLKYHIKLKDLKGKQTRTVEMTQNDLDSITAELPDNVKKWADKLYSDFYNGEASKTYKEKYLEFTGVEPDMEEGYFPRRRGDLTQKGIDASNTNWSPKYMNGLDQPFNKARTNSHNPLDFTDDLYTFTDNYIKELSVFATETPYMKKFDSLNTKFATKSVISRISELIPEGGKMVDYWIKRFLEVPTSKGDNTFADLMSKSITALFGLNFSSAAKQVISSLKIPLMTGWRAYAYGLIHGLANLWPGRYGKTIEDITTRSGLMKSRFTDNEILKANTLVNKVGKIGKVTGFLMNAIDQMVIVTTAWSAAQYKAQELGFGKIGTSENKDKAAKILDEIVLKTQSNSESIDVSRIRGGDLGTFSKMLFGMFGADNQKMLEWINDATRKDNYTAARLKHYDELFDHFEEKIKEQDDVLNNPESSERERQEAQAKKENYESMKETFRKRQEADKEAVSPRRRAKKIAVVLGIMLLSAGMSAGITALVNKYLKGKDVKGQDVAMDFASESVSWIPYLGTIVNAILNKQDSLNAASLSSLNNLLSLAQQLYTTGSKGTWDADKMKLVYKGLSAFGSLTGLPFKNLLDYSSGISKTWGGTWGDQFYNWVHGYDSSVIVARAKSDYESGDLTSATKSISTLMTLYKSGSVDWDTSREIARLYGEKLSVMPKNYMTEYKDENGDTKTLTQGQLSSFQKEYSKANKIAEKLIKTSEYKALSDDGKARALKKLFDSFYDSAKSKALGIQASSKLGQILSLSGGDIDLANIILLMQQLASLTTDQKSTRKEKAVKVVNSATDMDKGERLLSLWLDGYGLDDQSTSYLRKYLVGLGADSKLVSQTID